MAVWFLVPLAYFLGSLSSAVIVSRLFRLPDPREQGSKNPGATNVLRLGGKKAAAITLLGDAAKGLVPILLAKAFDADLLVIALVGLAAFFGHLYPVFFQFKGGKGVATALGVLLGFSWMVGLAALLTWIAIAFVSRISSLAALAASVLAPVYVWLLTGSEALIGASVVMVLFLIWRHRGNIERLRHGQEARIGRKA
ncbi:MULTISPECIES: glycerol-3-phosphate 1-O-acyltransferase PlsY [Methylocaldum]|jgi:glycerol-3-phosphate acyltransferase PlsY|uniref:glycerol-3-phosphate 1-O-acyltransferase PlsY n=1 Tax=unclassified Methylocaldum TaxID=2622260 RepID=UPI00098A3046|nr:MULTISPECIES: glycerol-3-phosphate 1-O-acyltransferase PlsY [unclassified Methylocaldum]MBP1148500.1 glycerol-3-phosphate acyltransferase PlsY [Methylocaldum sp. RMAD-M]MDV3240227.1 glycerol-3-phosphate 1-O-acyltransferase PlsY [Methylocaldum sp.]MVF21991.1 glycerol-3-phosphate 1-O-acyltransferase [Methylocaldum sp. BRCS4]